MKRYDDKMLDEVEALWHQGKTVGDISKIYDIPYGSASSLIQRLKNLGRIENRYPNKARTRPEQKIPKAKPKKGTVRCSRAVSITCKYGCAKDSSIFANLCNYILDTGHMRGCSPDECDKYEPRTKERSGKDGFAKLAKYYKGHRGSSTDKSEGY